MKELLRELTSDWTIEQFDEYISKLLKRREEVNDLLDDARSLRRKKITKSRKPLDTGARDGR